MGGVGMAYQDWFGSWHSGEIQLRGYFRPPEKLNGSEIPGLDRSAARLQEEARRLLADLAEYRQALVERYAYLETAPYTLRLKLERSPAWGSRGVTFELTLSRIYEDGTQVKELRETYPGKQRREAIARFEAMKKSRPGIEAAKDIEKRSWEK